MGTVANITTGPSNLFIAAAGTPLPTLTGNAADFSAFTPSGFTQDGVEWDYTPTWHDIMVDELMGPAKKKLVSHKLIVSAKLAETTLANLNKVIAASTLVSATQLTIGSVQDAPEFILGWMGPAPNGGTRQALVDRVVSIAATKAHYQRKDMAVYQVQFEALADATQSSSADLATYKDFTTAFVLS